MLLCVTLPAEADLDYVAHLESWRNWQNLFQILKYTCTCQYISNAFSCITFGVTTQDLEFLLPKSAGQPFLSLNS